MTTAMLSLHMNNSEEIAGGFEKTDDIVHYRSGPRISSGYASQETSKKGSPVSKSSRKNQNHNINSNGRRKAPANTSSQTTIANTSSQTTIGNDVINQSVTAVGSIPKRDYTTKAQTETEFEPEENQYNEATSSLRARIHSPLINMAPNNSRSQDDGSAIISGHKIALNVHYDKEKQHDQHYQQNGSIRTPPGSSGVVTPVVIDEQPALRELDEVIASAQRSSAVAQYAAASPTHSTDNFVDAAEDLQVAENQYDEKITHVDGVMQSPTQEQSEGPLCEGASLSASHPSASSLKDLPTSRTSSPERSLDSPHSGSSVSVDGQALPTSVEEQQQEAATPTATVMEQQNEYLQGPDQIIPAISMKTWLPNGAVKLHMQEQGLASHAPLSVPTLLKKTAEKYPNVPAMMEKRGTEWVGTSYSQYYQQVRTVAKAFIKLGLQPYHGVCILGFNSPQWFISDLAAIFAGGFAAGIYTTNSAEACQHCALNCQSQIWVVEDQKQLEKVLKIKGNVPSIKTIIQYKGKPTAEGVLSWDEVLETGLKESDEALEERLKRIAVNQCSTLIYTSGTTGPPKGVMLSHDNITWTALSASVYFSMVPGKEVVVSYLPLSHVAAQLADIYMTMINAGTAYFAQPDALKGSLGVTLREVRPTAFLGVPRVWEKIHEKMMDVGRKTKGVKKSIATWAKSVGLEANDRKQNADFSKPLGFSVANAVVFKKVKQVLGLDRCRIFLSGAAPIAPDIVKYFHSLDICLVEIYGMSESTGPHTTGIEKAFKVGSAGRSMPGCLTKIQKPDADGNGEICMAGRNISMGYLLKEETTNETLDDEGWLHSGDIGKIDESNFLFITGRLKELIITAGGENIPPVLIEDMLKGELPCISNAMLIGDKRKFLSILLTLKTNMNLDTGEALDTLSPACIEWCQSIGSNAKNIYEVLSGPDPKIMRAIQDGIDRTNKNAASNAQKIQKWTILPRDFTVLGDELGPTMKLKRPVVTKKYSETIEKFYK